MIMPVPRRERNIQANRVFVTGGADFIGSNLANRLVADNDVIAVDDTYLGTPENCDDDVVFVKAAVVDVDVAFHLAALSSRNMHENDPEVSCFDDGTDHGTHSL